MGTVVIQGVTFDIYGTNTAANDYMKAAVFVP